MNTKRMTIPAGYTEEPMQCPKCGAIIPEGKLYCEKCGEEIHFVPEFEPEVDDHISSVLNSVASEIALENENSAASVTEDTRFFTRLSGDEDDFVEFKIRISKNTLKAVTTGLCVVAVIILAVINIPRILRIQVFDKNSQASTSADPAVKQENGTDTAESEAKPADDSVNKVVKAPDKPVIEPKSGRYEDELEITIPDRDSSLRYYYTINGDDPSENGERYLAPIVLTEEGEYTIRAAAMNEDGVYSEQAIGVYSLTKSGPAAPVILEDSGDYTQSTMIVAVMQEGCRITYTTDGSEPNEDSAEYTAPIVMPIGNSLFRFRAFDSEGNASEVIDRTYHLVYARLVSEEQAVSSVINVLIKKDVLLDNTGKARYEEGYNSYRVDSVIVLEGAGEYYRIVESYGPANGEKTDTGLLYAVNTNDGSVHRLGYDSSGNYTLFTLSGR